MRNLQQVLNQVLTVEKVHRIIKFKREVWLKLNFELSEYGAKKKCKKWFCKRFIQVDEQCSFWKN